MEEKQKKELERKMKELRRRIGELGLMHPGSLRQQFNVCGTPGCKCKDKDNPVKHGPYYNLSFTFRGKNRTRFIREERVLEFKQYVANYATFRGYVDELVGLNMEIIELQGAKR
jgi:hypothetical protein